MSEANFLSDYHILSKTPDFFLLENKSNPQKAYYKEYFGSKLTDKEYKLVSDNFQKRKSITSQNLLQVYDYFISKQSLNYKFGLIYEHWSQNFDQELESKLSTSFYWTEEELINTIEASLQGLWVLHTNNITHGDIRSNNIVVNEEGYVKLGDQFVTSMYYKKSMKQILAEKASFLSPETLLICETSNLMETAENDIWALGMIFLSAASLLEVNSCYDWQNKKILYEILNKRFCIVKSRYTKKLSNILEIMLDIEPMKRREVYVLFGMKNYESVDREALALNDIGYGIGECIVSPKFEENHIDKKIDRISIEGLVEKHQNTKREFVDYIRKEIDKRQKSLDRLKNLLKEAGSLDKDANEKLYIEKQAELRDITGTLKKEEDTNRRDQKINILLTTVPSFNPMFNNNDINKNYENNDVNNINNDDDDEGYLAHTNSNSMYNNNNTINNVDNTNIIDNNNSNIINHSTKINSSQKPTPQKKSSLSIIKDKYFQVLCSNIMNNIKPIDSSSNHENKLKSSAESSIKTLVNNKNFDDFSIIKNEEGVSLSSQEFSISNDLKSSAQLNKTQEIASNNNHLKTLNKRLEECLIKSKGNTPSPSNQSFEMKTKSMKNNINNDVYKENSLQDRSNNIQFISNSLIDCKASVLEENKTYEKQENLYEKHKEQLENYENIYEKHKDQTSIKKVSYDKGDIYEGEVIGSIRQGYGTLYSKNKRIIYQGEWENDVYNGHGVKHNLHTNVGDYKEGFPYCDFNKLRNCWSKYEGGFIKGKKWGSGVLMLGNNEYFQGSFVNDEIHGKGTFQKIGGKRIIGEWNNNKLICKIN